MSDITLIQLVSGQAMPNLLAAMALDPARIVHLCTDTEATQRGARALLRAYKAAGLHPLVTVETLSRMPLAPEVKNVVSSLMENDASAVLNFTGGTKLMSLGAFTAALVLQRPSFYVDTDNNVFVDGHTSDGFGALFPDGDTSITRIRNRLSVPIVAIANGVERADGGRAWKPFLPLARFLLENDMAEAQVQQWAADACKKQPVDFRERRACILERYAAPLPDKLEAIAGPAIESGLFERRGGGLFLAGRWKGRIEAFAFADGPKPFTSPQKYQEFFAAWNEALLPLQFLQGTWWEVAVADHLARRGDCRDIRWSVQVGSRNADNTDMEEDILGIADGLNLLYVSCKRGGDKSKLSRFLEDVESGAKRVGGSFARKILAVCLRPKPYQWRQLKGRAEELRIELLTREDILAGGEP